VSRESTEVYSSKIDEQLELMSAASSSSHLAWAHQKPGPDTGTVHEIWAKSLLGAWEPKAGQPCGERKGHRPSLSHTYFPPSRKNFPITLTRGWRGRPLPWDLDWERASSNHYPCKQRSAIEARTENQVFPKNPNFVKPRLTFLLSSSGGARGWERRAFTPRRLIQ